MCTWFQPHLSETEIKGYSLDEIVRGVESVKRSDARNSSPLHDATFGIFKSGQNRTLRPDGFYLKAATLEPASVVKHYVQ